MSNELFPLVKHKNVADFTLKNRPQYNVCSKSMQKIGQKFQIRDSGDLQNLLHLLGPILRLQLHGFQP